MWDMILRSHNERTRCFTRFTDPSLWHQFDDTIQNVSDRILALADHNTMINNWAFDVIISSYQVQILTGDTQQEIALNNLEDGRNMWIFIMQKLYDKVLSYFVGNNSGFKNVVLDLGCNCATILGQEKMLEIHSAYLQTFAGTELNWNTISVDIQCGTVVEDGIIKGDNNRFYSFDQTTLFIGDRVQFETTMDDVAHKVEKIKRMRS